MALKTQLARFDAAMAGASPARGILIPACADTPLQKSTVTVLRARVGCVTVVGVGMRAGAFYSLFVSEEGMLWGAERNARASALARQHLVGDALLVADSQGASREECYLDLSPDDAQAVIDDAVTTASAENEIDAVPIGLSDFLGSLLDSEDDEAPVLLDSKEDDDKAPALPDSGSESDDRQPAPNDFKDAWQGAARSAVPFSRKSKNDALVELAQEE